MSKEQSGKPAVSTVDPGDCSTTEAALPCGLRCALPRMIGIVSRGAPLAQKQLVASKLFTQCAANCCMATLIHIAKNSGFSSARSDIDMLVLSSFDACRVHSIQLTVLRIAYIAGLPYGV